MNYQTILAPIFSKCVKIYDKFFKRKQDIEENKGENKLIFSLKNGTISMSLEIEDEHHNAGLELGQLLYSINSGNLEEPMATMLVNLGETNPEFTNLTQEIIKHWIFNKNLKSNEPYISPLKVFQQ